MAERLTVDRAFQVLETYNRQIELLMRQLNFIQAVADETRRARASLEGLGKAASGELLVPLGANTFIHAKLTDTDQVLAGIGASLSVHQKVDEAKARLGSREDDLRKEMQGLSEEVVRLQQEAGALQEEIQAAMEGAPDAA